MSSQTKPAATESPAQGTIENVVNPKLWPEPSTIRNPELYKYTSLDTLKIQQSFRNYKRSAGYIRRIWFIFVKASFFFKIVGILGGCFLASVLVNNAIKYHIYGPGGNFSPILKKYTKNNALLRQWRSVP